MEIFLDEKQTEIIRKRYDRDALFYDFSELPFEWLFFRKWRRLLVKEVRGKVLEVGVGTGKNFPYYPAGSQVTAIDFSLKMLAKAEKKAARSPAQIKVRVMDVQDLQFPDQSFDTVIASFVFCSVPDPVRGLQEVKRVLKKDGQLILLEHVLTEKQPMRTLMNWFNPVVVRALGLNINRETCANIRLAGFRIIEEQNLLGDVFKLIKAIPAV